MEELLTLANRLGGVSFATLLLLILYGSWKKIWVWGRELAEQIDRQAEEVDRLIEEKNYWKDLAERTLGLAEVQGQILRVKEHKELQKVDSLNKRLIENG